MTSGSGIRLAWREEKEKGQGEEKEKESEGQRRGGVEEDLYFYLSIHPCASTVSVLGITPVAPMALTSWVLAYISPAGWQSRHCVDFYGWVLQDLGLDDPIGFSWPGSLCISESQEPSSLAQSLSANR